MLVLHTIGRRKTAIARLYIAPGKGKIFINEKDINNYFTNFIVKYKIYQPFNFIKQNDFDIFIRINGGGVNSQAEAIRLALSRAFCNINYNIKNILKSNGFLTRDSRKIERKKFGRKKARKKFQFSKR